MRRLLGTARRTSAIPAGLAVRSVTCSRPLSSQSTTEVSKELDSRRKVVKKNFHELPSIDLPNSAVDLGEWHGGLDSFENECDDYSKRVFSEIKTTRQPTEGPQKEGDPIATVKLPRRRKSKKDAMVDTSIIGGCEPSNKVAQMTDEAAEDADDDIQPSSPLAIEILENLARFPHCILLTRVGQFYESYFSQAEEVSRLLGIKLTTRRWGGNGKRVPMCGFPLPHLDKYLKVLVQQNKRFVALCEEFRRAGSGMTKEFDRRVSRVVTPGTLIDESFINPYDNNYLLSLSTGPKDALDTEESNLIGLAWIDVSTGEFFTKSVPHDDLRDELARITPREIVLEHRLNDASTNPISELLRLDDYFVAYGTPEPLPTSLPAPGYQNPPDSFLPSPDAASSSTPSIHPSEMFAINLLTSYLRANLREHMPVLPIPSKELNEQRMQIDAHTIQALEIKESGREGSVKGSLLNTVRRTTTSGGTRLLSRLLCSPSTSVDEINARQSIVSFFKDRPHFQTDILYLIEQAEDITRIVQKFILGRGEISDLLSVDSTIRVWDAIQARAQEEKTMEQREKSDFDNSEWANLESLIARMTDLRQLSTKIELALSRNGSEHPADEIKEFVGLENNVIPQPQTWTELKWTIRPQFSEHLTQLHETLNAMLRQRAKLESSLQLRYNAPSLTLRTSPGLGTHVHLAKAKRDQGKVNQDSSFVSIAESGTTKCYFYPEWSQLGNKILLATEELALAEKRAFEQLRNEVIVCVSQLRRNARVLDELDVALGFSKLAQEMNFVRPTVTKDPSYLVVNGRHPTVELGLLTSGRLFTPNTVALDSSSYLRIQTGPNMAGKSTLLRQTALIAILAQTGSFVPADSAKVGIVDKVFSRVGAHDDLFHDRSTFMVEMMETSDILRRATPNSLVIMDEVGRGTTVKEGLAIAFATVHHLVTVNKCRSLFATHFHELADLLGYTQEDHKGTGQFRAISFFCSSVDDTNDGHFAYSYQARPGINRDSQGLRVARIAGMPPAALDIAENIFRCLKRQEDDEAIAQKMRSLGQSFAQSKHGDSYIERT